jgi:hypothetical protein
LSVLGGIQDRDGQEVLVADCSQCGPVDRKPIGRVMETRVLEGDSCPRCRTGEIIYSFTDFVLDGRRQTLARCEKCGFETDQPPKSSSSPPVHNSTQLRTPPPQAVNFSTSSTPQDRLAAGRRLRPPPTMPGDFVGAVRAPRTSKPGWEEPLPPVGYDFPWGDATD